MDENFTIPSEILNDLCSRFIINVPEEERKDLIRIFFQIELAHWFYIDFFCNENSSLKPCSIKNFAENIFRHCSFLMEYSNQVDVILSRWKTFKHAVPTNGAIILDESMKYVLLVQGFWAKASWGFPKGKVVEEESEMKCAIREVLEETGYDITNKLKNDQYLEISINEQTIRLYIITNVPRNTQFEPRTRREIKEVRWFAIDELPAHRKDIKSKQSIGYSPNAFFMVFPFVKGLKNWINNYQKSQNLKLNESTSSSLQTASSLPTSTSYPSLQINKKSPSINQQLNKAELRKFNQQQHFNKLNKDEYDELVNFKDNNNKKFQKLNQNQKQQQLSSVNGSGVLTNAYNINTHMNSRFKPVKQQKQQQQQQHVQSTNIPGVLNITTTRTLKNLDIIQTQQQPVQLQQQQQQNLNIKIKKQLDFSGPEIWLNFKFDYENLLNDLPASIIL